MALWHLARHVNDLSLGTEILPAAARPKKITTVAVDASKAGLPVFQRHEKEKVQTKSLWGEIAFGLGKEKAWKSLRDADDAERQPDEGLLESLFPSGPVLLLLDELVVYMATLSERGQGNLLAFLNKLAAVVGKRPQTVLVVTDPADQRAYAKEASKLGDSLTAAAVKLDDMFGRKMTDFDPIGDESARVIVRRLFEKVDSTAAEAASAAYHSLFERVARESPGSVPASAAGRDFARRVVECYPFHPRLLDTAQGRLAALQEFNKSRGTLRLFARILRTVKESNEDLDLISAGDVDWSSDRLQADLLQRLNRDSFKAAVLADVEGHARELDGGKSRGIHARVASALLLESIPLQSNSGLDPAELTLAVLRPDEAGPEPAEALDRLVGVCWHTYPMPGGRGWQFRYEPNIIKQIEERMGRVPREDATNRVYAEVQGYFSGPAFKVPAPWPTAARQVPESTELQLVLCEDEKVARSVCAFSDDTDSRAPIPRRFQNATVAVTAAGPAFNAAVERAQRLLAAEAIEREHKTGETSKLVREQLQRIKPELEKQFRIQTCRAFDRVVLAGGVVCSLEEQYQVPEEQILKRAQGQACLMRFLDGKGLIYQSGDSLDVDRFLKEVLPGATPTADSPEVYSARALHERFLSAPGLRLIPDGGIVRTTILKAVEAGKVAVRLSDGRAYDAKGCVQGPAGSRRRYAGSLNTLSLDDSVLAARVNSPPALLWLKEDPLDTGKGEGGEAGAGETGGITPPPPAPARGTATTWEQLLGLARERRLLDLKLTARTPASAASLLPMAQPLGAETLELSVAVSGTSKDGGSINFQASNLKPTNPTRPLQIAQTLFNALAEGATYEAELALRFGAEGRAGVEAQLASLADGAADDILPRATFEKPDGTKP